MKEIIARAPVMRETRAQLVREPRPARSRDHRGAGGIGVSGVWLAVEGAQVVSPTSAPRAGTSRDMAQRSSREPKSL